MYPNIDYCYANGVMVPNDTARLVRAILCSRGFPQLAAEYRLTLDEAPYWCLDGGIVFMRAALLEGPSTDGLFSPPPVPDRGWDALAANPAEAVYYGGFCVRLCRALGVPPVILEHVTLTPERQVMARDTGAVARVISVMERRELPFRRDHWPVDAGATCETGHLPKCKGRLVGV